VRYSHRYRAYPDWTNTTSECEHHINIARQLYNHIRHDYQNSPDKNKPSEYDQNNQLPNWKDKWEVFGDLHSKVAQDVTSRIHQNLSNLFKKKQNGGKVGWLRHKCRGEYQSITYSQSGFELKNNNDRTGYRNLTLSKIGTIPIRYHRELPDTAVIKEVTLKKEASGIWYVSFGFTIDAIELPDKKPVNELENGDVIGLDLGVNNYIHTSDGLRVSWLDLKDEYERLESAQRDLSCKEHGSNNWENQRKHVSKQKLKIQWKVVDFQHKLTTWLTKQYECIVVEDLEVQKLLGGSMNARNMQDCSWSRFTSMLEYKGELYGCRIVEVPARGTTKECNECGVETEKPLWVREHSCPSCGFELDRDWNAALNVVQRGLEKLGMGDAETTLVETGTAVDDDSSESVTASSVVEARSLGV
jgi:putative transposase